MAALERQIEGRKLVDRRLRDPGHKAYTRSLQASVPRKKQQMKAAARQVDAKKQARERKKAEQAKKDDQARLQREAELRKRAEGRGASDKKKKKKKKKKGVSGE